MDFRTIGRAAGVALVFATLPTTLCAQDLPEVKLGLLKFGTVNWEAQTIVDRGLDRKHGFQLEIVTYGGDDATKIAMQAGEIEITTGDWLFASRQRAEGSPLTFVPFSSSIGAIMVPCNSDIKSLSDLKGKTLGIAGGPLDKSWLMLQALAEGEYDFSLTDETEQVFGAPPLLAEKLRQGELDAGLNYWHYNARLEADGYCQIVSAQEAARELGAEGDISAVGYILNEDWANAHREVAKGFVAASQEAKALLKSSDEAWDAIRPTMNIDTDAEFEALRRRFREGIPERPVVAEEKDTEAVYRYLARVGGEKLVGPATEMAEGTFWSELKHGS
ncbi:ABC transporter substrate-binding protein [Consotaella aegiceratis]|uniref:ABC transporter substrate-binding protein n=1 Tax=Consotaella aegiceratis TaxID=3097961 RepID=UPI002F40100A